MMHWLLDFVGRFGMIFLNLLQWAVIIHILLSWFAAGRTPIGQMLESVVRPMMKPFLKLRIGLFSFAPIVVLLLIDGLRMGLSYGVVYLKGLL